MLVLSIHPGLHHSAAAEPPQLTPFSDEEEQLLSELLTEYRYLKLSPAALKEACCSGADLHQTVVPSPAGREGEAWRRGPGPQTLDLQVVLGGEHNRMFVTLKKHLRLICSVKWLKLTPPSALWIKFMFKKNAYSSNNYQKLVQNRIGFHSTHFVLCVLWNCSKKINLATRDLKIKGCTAEEEDLISLLFVHPHEEQFGHSFCCNLKCSSNAKDRVQLFVVKIGVTIFFSTLKPWSALETPTVLQGSSLQAALLTLQIKTSFLQLQKLQPFTCAHLVVSDSLLPALLTAAEGKTGAVTSFGFGATTMSFIHGWIF